MKCRRGCERSSRCDAMQRDAMRCEAASLRNEGASKQPTDNAACIRFSLAAVETLACLLASSLACLLMHKSGGGNKWSCVRRLRGSQCHARLARTPGGSRINVVEASHLASLHDAQSARIRSTTLYVSRTMDADGPSWKGPKGRTTTPRLASRDDLVAIIATLRGLQVDCCT
jgi:hypothetical protein